MASGLTPLVVATPDIASFALNGTLTGGVRQPWSSAAGEAASNVSVGGVASRLIVTDSLVVPPADVAVHVNVVPAVSAITALVEQPVRAAGELLVVTVHVSCTSPVYQPALPCEPEIAWV